MTQLRGRRRVWGPGRPRATRPTRSGPALERLETRQVLTPFTITSPTQLGLLPSGITPVGGLVLDLIGTNGRRVVSQVPASQLFNGIFNSGTPQAYQGNPGTIGAQSGLSGAILDALGGGLAELAVRVTLHDGDTGPGEFDRNENELLLNGIALGNFSAIRTQETTSNGQTALSENPDGGFRNDRLDTGFFHTTDSAFLTALYQSLVTAGQVTFQLRDVDPYDNLFDFTRGVDGGLTDVGKPPEVVNAPPIITAITANGPVPLGVPFTVGITANDPDGPSDQLTYAFDFDGDGVDEVTNQSGTATFTYAALGTFTVKVRVTDSLGGEATGTTTVTVFDPSPSTQPPLDQTAFEGTAADFALGSFQDAAGGPWTIVVDWGDGSPHDTFEVSRPGDLGPRSHFYGQDGAYTVRVTVNDGQDQDTTTFGVTVSNVAPSIDPLADQLSTEGNATIFALGAFEDPGALDTWTAQVDWGDGTVETFATAPGPLGERTHAYAQDGAYRVTISVRDDDTVRSRSFNVSVANAAPSLTAPANQSAIEGVAAALDLGSFSDLGMLDSWSALIDWGDGTTESFATAPGSLGALVHTYAQDGDYRVTVSVSDDDTTSQAAFQVRVANVAPVVTAPVNQSTTESAPTNFDLGSFSDLGVLDSWSALIDWGDGTTESFATAPGSLGALVHTYAQDGDYRVTVNVSDDDTTSTASFDVAVANVAPTLVQGPTQSSSEGATTDFALGSFLDPGIADTWSVTVAWGDGTVDTFNTTPGPLGRRAHAYAQDGAYRVTVSVSDDDVTRTAAFGVLVANVAPVLTMPADQTATEGVATSFTLGSFADPGMFDAWNAVIDWGDGTTESFATAPGSLGALVHAYAQDGDYRVTVSVSDDDTTSQAAFQVRVANVAPVVTAPVNQSTTESAPTNFDLGSFSDLGVLDSWSALIDWGDGTTETFTATPGALGARSHTYAQDGSYRVVVSVADDDATSITTFDVAVTNVAPVLTTPVDQTTTEGAATSFALGSFSDPGVVDTWNAVIDWGDGTTESFATAPGSLGALVHAYAQDGDYRVTVSVSDDDATNTATFDVAVTNVAPVLTTPVDQATTEGAATSFALGSFADPGVVDTWSATVDWGDGTVETFTAAPGSLGALVHTYAQDGDYRVTVSVSDDDATNTATFEVAVTNVAPVLTTPVDQTTTEGAATSFALGSFADPGVLDSWTIVVDWGDGTTESFVASPGPIDALVHAYAEDGDYRVTVNVSDDGATSTTTFDVAVTNVAPVLTTPVDQATTEGAATSFALGSFSDPGVLDSWTIVVDWGDGTVETFTAAPGPLGELGHTYAQDGDYRVSITVADDDEARSTTFDVAVANVAPMALPARDQTSLESASTDFALGSFVDPGALDSWTIVVDWGDGSPPEAFEARPGQLGDRAHVYEQNGAYLVSVSIADDDAVRTFSFGVTVANVAPALTAPMGQSASEGAAAPFDLGAFIDPGRRDAWSLLVDWGDGSPIESLTLDRPGALGARPHRYEQDGAYLVTLRLSDDDATAATTFGVTIINQAPALDAPPAQMFTEGVLAQVSLGAFQDLGDRDLWTAFVDWGDGSPPEPFDLNRAGDIGGRDHAYEQDGAYTVVVLVSDGTATSTSSFILTVANVPPDLEDFTASHSVPAETGLLTLEGVLSDPGVQDGWLLTLDWGNGTTTSVPLDQGPFVLRLRPPDTLPPGAWTVTATLADDDGGLTTRSFEVLVQAPEAEPAVAFVPPMSETILVALATSLVSDLPDTQPIPAGESHFDTRMALAATTSPVAFIGGTSAAAAPAEEAVPAPPPPSAPATVEEEAPAPPPSAPATVEATPAPLPAAIEVAATTTTSTTAPEVAVVSDAASAEATTSNIAGIPPVLKADTYSGGGAVTTTLMVLAVVQQRQMRARRGKAKRFKSRLGANR